MDTFENESKFIAVYRPFALIFRKNGVMSESTAIYDVEFIFKTQNLNNTQSV